MQKWWETCTGDIWQESYNEYYEKWCDILFEYDEQLSEILDECDEKWNEVAYEHKGRERRCHTKNLRKKKNGKPKERDTTV